MKNDLLLEALLAVQVSIRKDNLSHQPWALNTTLTNTYPQGCTLVWNTGPWMGSKTFMMVQVFRKPI